MHIVFSFCLRLGLREDHHMVVHQEGPPKASPADKRHLEMPINPKPIQTPM